MTDPRFHFWRAEFGHDYANDTEAMRAFLREQREARVEYTRSDLDSAVARAVLVQASPSLALILDLQRGVTDLYDVPWRAFERLVADLLHGHGWSVELQRGTKDGGVDVIAHRHDPQIGLIRTVWQAKKLSRGNKVGISVIRELADTRVQRHATKGFVVTSSYLTRGALERVTCDQYLLGKVDRDDLWNWIKQHPIR